MLINWVTCCTFIYIPLQTYKKIKTATDIFYIFIRIFADKKKLKKITKNYNTLLFNFILLLFD